MSVLAVEHLTDLDKAEARRVGMARYQRAVDLGRSQPFGDPGDGKRSYIDCYSALAECAVANWLGLPWRKEIVDDLSVKPPDVGDRIEVRWTSRPHGHLICHATDTDHWIMVLVRGELPHMRIDGWTVGKAAKQSRYQDNRQARSPDDFWVPAGDLLSADLLTQMRL